MREEHDLSQGEELDYAEGLGDDQPPPAPPHLTPLPKDFPGREKSNLSIWFGDSKIRNKRGAPLRMFHGTNAAFSTFRIAPGGMYGPGIYFTDDPDMANNYAKNPGAFGKSIEDLTAVPNVIPAYLRVVRPFVVPGGYPNDSLSFMAKSAGYDGIVIRNPGHPFHVVVVFDPRQVKSATGNLGDYDWRSEDITTEGQIDEALLRRVIRSTLLNEARITPDNLPDDITFRLSVSSSGGMIRVSAYKHSVEFGEVIAHKVQNDDVPCYGAFEVRNSYTQFRGFGPIIYDIAMEAATALGSGLMSDRSAVSDRAYPVWNYYQNNRPDVTRQQLDSPQNELTPIRRDNCSVMSSKNIARDEQGDERRWPENPLAGVYEKPGMETVRRLMSMGKIILKGIDV